MLIASQELSLLIILLMSLCVLSVYSKYLYEAVHQLPQIPSQLLEQPPPDTLPTISVIIPVYNETENIADCIQSILASTPRSFSRLEVWVVDDQSTDDTPRLVKMLQAELADSRLHLLIGAPRPVGQTWTGKNWACHQAVSYTQSEWLLFIDADVRLKPGAISAVLQTAKRQDLDLLTCIPEIVCGSLIEWLVQPLIFINVLISFNSAAVKDPTTPTSYALGPFLLFRSAAYDRIGGHAAVAAEVAEDVAFARKLKQHQFRIRHMLGANIASLRMYRTWQSLWEGWTKVLYVGANRNVSLMLLLALVMILIYLIPWLGLVMVLYSLLANITPIKIALLGLAVSEILLQYWLRVVGSQALGTASRYWWLHSIGGGLVATLAMASVIKVETGWGWTWRGRPLQTLKRP